MTSGTLVGAPTGSGGSATKIGGDLDLIPILIRTGGRDGDREDPVVLDITRANQGGDLVDREDPVVLDITRANRGGDLVGLVVLGRTRADPRAPADLAITSALVSAPERHGRASIVYVRHRSMSGS